MDYLHVYDLSFVPPRSSKEINPHLVFSMSERHLEIFQAKLHFITQRIIEDAIKEYFGAYSEFTPPDKDLFGNRVFGYGTCGYVNIKDRKIHFNFELSDSARANYISMTIRILLMVLNNMSVDEEVKLPNRQQFIQIDTVCRNDVHGHSVSGYISPDFGMWLKKQGGKIPDSDQRMLTRVSLPIVEEVMRQTWNKVTHRELWEDMSEYRATIAPDGRFNLKCPGNACDVSIYPDQLYGDSIGTRSVQFGCHNLDSAAQQITLLAGIAKLCELARNKE